MTHEGEHETGDEDLTPADVVDDSPELGDDLPLNPAGQGPFPGIEDQIEDHDPASDPNRWVEAEEHEREVGGEG